MEKIKWQDKISNEEVLIIVDENRGLMRTKREEKESDRTCDEGRWTVERRAGGKNVGEQTARQTKDGNDRRTKGDRDEGR